MPGAVYMVFKQNIITDFLRVVLHIPDIREHLLRIMDPSWNKFLCVFVFLNTRFLFSYICRFYTGIAGLFCIIRNQPGITGFLNPRDSAFTAQDSCTLRLILFRCPSERLGKELCLLCRSIRMPGVHDGRAAPGRKGGMERLL